MPTPIIPEGDEGRISGRDLAREEIDRLTDKPDTSGNTPAGPVKGKGEHLPPDPVDVAKDGQG